MRAAREVHLREEHVLRLVSQRRLGVMALRSPVDRDRDVAIPGAAGGQVVEDGPSERVGEGLSRVGADVEIIAVVSETARAAVRPALILDRGIGVVSDRRTPCEPGRRKNEQTRSR